MCGSGTDREREKKTDIYRDRKNKEKQTLDLIINTQPQRCQRYVLKKRKVFFFPA